MQTAGGGGGEGQKSGIRSNSELCVETLEERRAGVKDMEEEEEETDSRKVRVDRYF